MSTGAIVAGVASLALVVTAIVALVVVLAIKGKNKRKKKNAGTTVPDAAAKDSGAQNEKVSAGGGGGATIDVRKIAGAPNGSVAPDGSLRVTNPAGGFASRGGFVVGVPVNPPSENATLTFEVLFESGWCWGKGGKLPGLWLGSDGAACGTGGAWGPNCGSLRFMFDKDGQPYCYIYYASPKSQPDMSEQTVTYRAAAKDSGKTGHSMFKRELGKLVADGTTWNKMSLSVTLNAVGKADGSFSATVDGATKKFEGMRWRTAADHLIRTVLVHQFHGGGNASWSCPGVTHARFRNFVVKSS